MALLTRSELVGEPLEEGVRRMRISAARATLLKESLAAPLGAKFDIFLSHSSKYAREVRAIKRRLERLGYSVYVDWVEDEELDRSKVTPATAARLRQRIASSRSLLVHASEGVAISRWVPWELGVADGFHHRVAILPVLATNRRTVIYKGAEYLGLYPYVDFAPDTRTYDLQPWVRRNAKTYVSFDGWLKGKNPFRRSR
jgi:hypothetical protein